MPYRLPMIVAKEELIIATHRLRIQRIKRRKARPARRKSDRQNFVKNYMSYDNGFGPNTHKLSHILRFSTMAVQGYLADMKAALSGLPIAAQTNPPNIQNLTDMPSAFPATRQNLRVAF